MRVRTRIKFMREVCGKDYIVNILKKVKSSRTWQVSEFKDWMWDEVGDAYAMVLPDSDRLEIAILKTASELGVPSQAIKLWVHLYAARNGNEGHHRGIANLIARKDTRGVVRQFIDDKKSIYDLTPERLQGSISSVLLAIDKYRKELFRKCELRDYRVTKQGKKLG